jgi:hypothetical protein
VADQLRDLTNTMKLQVEQQVIQIKIARAQRDAALVGQILPLPPGVTIPTLPTGTTTSTPAGPVPPSVTLNGQSQSVALANNSIVHYAIQGNGTDLVRLVYMDSATVQLSSNFYYVPSAAGQQLSAGSLTLADTLYTDLSTPYLFYVTVQDLATGTYGNVIAVSVNPTSHGIYASAPRPTGTSSSSTATTSTTSAATTPGVPGTNVSGSLGVQAPPPAPAITPTTSTPAAATTTTSTTGVITPVNGSLPAYLSVTFSDGSTVQANLVPGSQALQYLGVSSLQGLIPIYDAGKPAAGLSVTQLVDSFGNRLSSWSTSTGMAGQVSTQLPVGELFVSLSGNSYTGTYVPYNPIVAPPQTAPTLPATGQTAGTYYMVADGSGVPQFQTTNQALAVTWINTYGGSMIAGIGQWPNIPVRTS